MEIIAPKFGRHFAFSLLEALVVVAVLGIAATLSLVSFGSSSDTVKRQKLESDVATINTAISNYLAFGGSLDGITEPKSVLDKLKTVANAESARALPGLSGSFIDPRVDAILQTKEETISDTPRAIWNTEKHRFVVSERGQNGVREFRLGEIAGEALEEARKGTMDYASGDGWVWDYEDRKPAENLKPFVATTSVPPSDIPSSPPSSAKPPKSSGPLELAPPRISIPSGIYSILEFDLPVSFFDPNPSGVGKIVFRIDEGDWTDFVGGTISAGPESEVFSRVVPIDPTSWTASQVESEVYDVKPEALLPPQILASAVGFSPGSEMVTVTLTNPNDSVVSLIRYRLGSGVWTTYSDPFDLHWGAFPGGVLVEAFAESTAPFYLDSPTAKSGIPDSLSPLASPTIAFDSDQFDNDVSEINVALTDPNEVGTSEIRYQIVPRPPPDGNLGATTGWLTYSGSFSVDDSEYPDGFGVKAYARAARTGYLDSDQSSRFATEVEGLFGGHLDLDTSDFLASIGKGKNSAHSHDITGKYNLTTINMFSIPDKKQVEIDEAITDSATRFKLIVANGDLSPGLTLSVTFLKDGVRHTVDKRVDQYGEIALEDLNTFSLGGVSGTAQLVGLSIKMTRDVIYEAAVVPTNTGDVKKNILGKNGEWRNGALTVQAVSMNADGSDGYTSSVALSAGGVQGAATSGLLWEAAIFWHWGGDWYHEGDNEYQPGDFDSIKDEIED